MSISAISSQAEPFRPRFNPGPSLPAFAPAVSPVDRSHIQFADEDGESEDCPGHLAALAGTFAQTDKPLGTSQASPEAVHDLRAGVRDWFPDYRPYLDLAALEV